MPGPTTTLGFIVATLCGAVFHLVIGGDARRLALFLLAAWVGFALGHTVGVVLGIDMLNIGPLRVVSAVVGAFVALVSTHILTFRRMASRPKR